MKQPRILVIQDISLSCRISMNVAVPVLSCLGNWVSMLPTALLSTHTGKGFEDYTFLDLSSEIPAVLSHWKKLGIKFDGLVIGYLGSIQQIDLMKEIIRNFTTEEATVVLDPVMGDAGQLYPGFTQGHVAAMRDLCRYADVLIPNLTEACYLTGAPFPTEQLNKDTIASILQKLSQTGHKKTILSGIAFDATTMGAAVVSAEKDTHIHYTFADVYPGHFDGTGDLFTSAVAGLVFQQIPLERATDIAVQYVSKVVKRTIDEQVDPLFGVAFERDLPYLMQMREQETKAQ